MGITYVEGGAAEPTDNRAPVRLLVDSGATYSLRPEDFWKALDLTPKWKQAFTLAGGTVIEQEVSECYLILPQREAHTPVILGEPQDEGLVGVVTLKILGLVFDPFWRTLQPMRMMLV